MLGRLSKRLLKNGNLIFKDDDGRIADKVQLKWSNGNGHLEKSDRLLERCSNDRREEKELYPGIQA